MARADVFRSLPRMSTLHANSRLSNAVSGHSRNLGFLSVYFLSVPIVDKRLSDQIWNALLQSTAQLWHKQNVSPMSDETSRIVVQPLVLSNFLVQLPALRTGPLLFLVTKLHKHRTFKQNVVGFLRALPYTRDSQMCAGKIEVPCLRLVRVSDMRVVKLPASARLHTT